MSDCRFTLVLNTSQEACSVACYGVQGEGIYHKEMSRGQSESIIPAVYDVLGQVRCDIRDLEQIVVIKGPGTYAGIRIALAAAYGLSAPWGIPLYAVNSLEAAYMSLFSLEDRHNGYCGVVLVSGLSAYVEVFEGEKRIHQSKKLSIDELCSYQENLHTLYSLKMMHVTDNDRMHEREACYVSYPTLEKVAKTFSFMGRDMLTYYQSLEPYYGEELQIKQMSDQ